MKSTFNWFKKYNTIKIFPIKDTEGIIHFICMANDNLIYNVSDAGVKLFSIENNYNCIADYKFDKII